jgi:uncharacterized protein YndB with AHSA1/START domain
MIIRCITKTVSIDAPVECVFAYLANAKNWPQWAIVNVKAVSSRDDDWVGHDHTCGARQAAHPRQCGIRNS